MRRFDKNDLTHLPWTKCQPFGRWRFESIFMNEKFCIFYSNFTENCFLESSWQKVSIGSGYGLVPNRQQAITWTSADSFHWLIYAALMEMSEKQYGRHVFILKPVFMFILGAWSVCRICWWIQLVLVLLNHITGIRLWLPLPTNVPCFSKIWNLCIVLSKSDPSFM